MIPFFLFYNLFSWACNFVLLNQYLPPDPTFLCRKSKSSSLRFCIRSLICNKFFPIPQLLSICFYQVSSYNFRKYNFILNQCNKYPYTLFLYFWIHQQANISFDLKDLFGAVCQLIFPLVITSKLYIFSPDNSRHLSYPIINSLPQS